VTSALQARQAGLTDNPPEQAHGGQRRRRESWFARDPAWPIVLTLAGWPVWWLLGLGSFIFPILAIPMVRRMYRWRVSGERTIRVPPGFGWWALFLLVVVLSVAELSLPAPGTLQSPVSHRLIAWAIRAIDYGAVTIMFLYAGNLTERELPRKRLAWLLGLVGIYTLVGGLGGVVYPHLQLTSPLAAVVPQSIQASDSTISLLLHPGLSQASNLLGYATGRPTAPFIYTNMWGECLAILLPWLLVVMWAYGTRRRRQYAIGVLLIALVPIVYSLDRGLWIGIGLSILYLAVRYAAQGRVALLVGLCGVLVLVVFVVLVTPLQGMITTRLQHGKSNSSRASLSLLAIQDVKSSPFLGYGDTRHMQGSQNSITVGRSAKCSGCGQRVVGGNGQLWLLLITTGVLGTVFYLGFFAYGSLRYWRDRTPYGVAGTLVLLLGFVYMFVYQAIGPPLAFTMLAYVLLWRNDRVLNHGEPSADDPSGRTIAASAPGGAVTAGASA